LADSPKDFAEPATRILADDTAVTDRRAFVLVSHCLGGAEKHTDLMEGITLTRGGSARRAATAVTLDPEAMEARKTAAQSRRRLEITQKLKLQNVTFPAGGDRIVATGGSVTETRTPTVQEDIYRVYSPEAILKWHQTCLDLEPKLAAFGPVHSRDPAAWLSF